MSIPDRLWRVVKGHWHVAQERVDQTQARADAYAELTEYLRKTSLPSMPPAGTGSPRRDGGRPAFVPPSDTSERPGVRDPMRACYALLGAEAGCSTEELERAYQQARTQVDPKRFAPGSAARAAADNQLTAMEVAYEKLRDALNPTETRFEKLEF